MPYIIYAVLESFIKKRDKCANKSEKSSPAKTDEHVLADIQCQLYVHSII